MVATWALALVIGGFSPVAADLEPVCDGQALDAYRVHACGTVTITGVGGDGFELHLPREVSISVSACEFVSYLCDQTFTGDGPFLGVGIWERGAWPANASTAIIGNLQNGHGGYVREVVHLVGFTQPPLESRVVVPAGNYNVVLMGEGEVSATLRLDGLDGTVTVAPPGQGAVLVRELASPVPQEVQGMVWSAGTAYHAEHRLVGWMTRSYTGYAAGAVGSCVYHGKVDQDTAFLPGCPGRLEGVEVTTFIGPAVVPGAYRQDSNLSGPEGDVTAGYWHTMAGLNTTRGVAYAFEQALTAPE